MAIRGWGSRNFLQFGWGNRALSKGLGFSTLSFVFWTAFFTSFTALAQPPNEDEVAAAFRKAYLKLKSQKPRDVNAWKSAMQEVAPSLKEQSRAIRGEPQNPAKPSDTPELGIDPSQFPRELTFERPARPAHLGPEPLMLAPDPRWEELQFTGRSVKPIASPRPKPKS